ncbi:bL17 family ribosomal protein [Alienimonas chondri]|uniref:Large ribosomal subunit protein bL17 n=1 Tax=Alienimonas chondri TaxID=2681879 RepID=A0ABX1V806_9PLAN|nr:bL17 family ribosomal protein [Alienimonas chondri]NNJ24161.1 50S ribosomal protein L17 [Alienimonas chondri]
MRHRMRGRKLGRNASHRKAMFKNMACSLIRTLRIDPDEPGAPLVSGRIVTTTPKAKELRPFLEKLITIGKKAKIAAAKAEEFATTAERGSAEYKEWREGEGWRNWTAARAPYVALRRRAFSRLRDDEAVDILFEELADRFENRPGGYTRIVRLAARRLGDGGEQAMIEFVGESDARSRSGKKRTAPVVRDDAPKVVADETTAEESTEPPSDDADASGPPPEAPETAEGEAAAGAAADEQPRNEPDGSLPKD